MISVLLLSMFYMSLSYNTAICDIEQYLDLAFDEEILDHARLGNSTDIVLTTKNIFILDEDLNVLNQTVAPSNGQYKCSNVVTRTNSNIFFVACQQEGQSPYFAAYQCNNGSECQPFGNYTYLTGLDEVFQKFEIIGNTLLIPQSNRVVFYTLVVQATTWYIRATSYVLDQQFFGRTSLNVTDFTAEPFEQDLQLYYRIFIVDYNDGILWVDAISRTNNLIPFNNGIINVKNSFYISYNAKFRGVVILKTVANTTQFIIQTYDDGAYHFETQYVQSTSQYIYLKTSLNKYKDWTPISVLRYSNNVAALSYQNYQKTVVTTLFNIDMDLVGEQDNKLTQDPNDLLVSASTDTFIFYFISDRRLVYKSDQDSLSRCALYNYKAE